MAGPKPSTFNYTHKQQSRSCHAQDEASVKALLVTVDSWLSPAAAGEDIVNIATGVVASDEVARDLVAAKAVGEATFQRFVWERIISSDVWLLRNDSKE